MKTKKSPKIRVTRTGRRLVIALVLGLSLGMCLTSCNVTRTITNQSEYFQRGDTAVVIQTKTVETYDASKKF